MHIYIVEFCNNLGFKNSKDNRYAKLKIIDDRNRLSGEFTITRSCLPKNTKPGDEVEFINLTRREINERI